MHKLKIIIGITFISSLIIVADEFFIKYIPKKIVDISTEDNQCPNGCVRITTQNGWKCEYNGVYDAFCQCEDHIYYTTIQSTDGCYKSGTVLDENGNWSYEYTCGYYSNITVVPTLLKQCYVPQ